MADAKSAQDIMKRLLEAEREARERLEQAETLVVESLAEARAEAQQRLQEARRNAELQGQRHLEEVRSQLTAQLEARQTATQRDIAALQGRAAKGFEDAVRRVVAWVGEVEG